MHMQELIYCMCVCTVGVVILASHAFSYERIQLIHTNAAPDVCESSLINDPGYRIPDTAITATSRYTTGQPEKHLPQCARLFNDTNVYGWITVDPRSYANEYLQYDLGAIRKVKGFNVQGRIGEGAYCHEYKVSYWNFFTSDWAFMEDDGGNDMIFAGPSDRNSIAYAPVPGSGHIMTNKIRWYPITCQEHMSARVDVLGC